MGVNMEQQRFESIDVFRGLTVAAMLLVNNAGDWSHVYPWLEHANWHGCTLADFIFPFFLVIVGVSLELAYAPKLAHGLDRAALIKAAWWRALKIMSVGIALHLIAMVLIPDRHFRLFGVLQRIGICFGIATTIALLVSTTVRISVSILGILLAYGLLMYFGGSYEPHFNLADRVDTALLGSWAYQFDPLSLRAQEPEGILSTIPAIANVLFGVLAARLLRESRWTLLVSLALLLMAVGFLAQEAVPWNKQLWTSSFVCWTSAWALMVIAFLHVCIDQWRLPAIGMSFGRNAIVAYAAAWVMSCLLAATNAMNFIYPELFANGIGHYTSPEFASFSFALLFTSVFAGAMYVLRRKGIRFSI